jgi:hypothetical protein
MSLSVYSLLLASLLDDPYQLTRVHYWIRVALNLHSRLDLTVGVADSPLAIPAPGESGQGASRLVLA